MLALLAALTVVSVSPQMVSAKSMNECPAGWTEHQPDGLRICYRYATWNFGESVDHAEATALCSALHAGSTLPMPKTAAQRDVLALYTKFDHESGHDPAYDVDHLGMDVNHTSGDHTWLDGESVDLERFRGDLGTCDDDACRIIMDEYYTSGDLNQDTSDTREYHSGFRYSSAGYRKHTDGKQLCQLLIKEWSCLADRVKTATSPFSHYDHQAVGCRQVLTCSARVMEDGALVNGLTVNLKQSAYGGGVSADIDLALQEDLLVSIAFTEGTSPRSEDDDAVTCKAESLGLFLSHHNLPAGHHGLWLLSAILGGHSQAGRPYQAGLHALGHGVVGHGYGRGGIYQAPRTLVKEAAVTGGIKSTFTIQRAGGFTSLAELAGHGVVVCPSDKVEEEDGVMRCLSDAIPVCCSLAWALEADGQYLD